MIRTAIVPTVLIVTPESNDSRKLRDLLEQSEWSVSTAQSGAEALRALRMKHVDVVACDEELPDGRWSNLYADVQEIDDSPAFVVLSHAADRSLWAEAMNFGAADVLCMPPDDTEVRLTLSRVVTRSRQNVRSAAGKT